MGVLINSMGVIFSQCMHMLSHHVVYFKHLIILVINYTSIKLKKRKKKECNGSWTPILSTCIWDIPVLEV